ncbi:MAG: NAD(P)H-dependent oxidoreductase subunit E [Deltaproteobacteria bacterium]|nr:NAD(P)H-dependent oxidoreductase subunit E [Deltaproteobacteria bacterium]
MSDILKASIEEFTLAVDNDRSRMMDVVNAVQAKYGCVSSEAMDLIAEAMDVKRVEVESVISFYGFLSNEQKGKVVIRLCNDVVDKMLGYDEVAAAFKFELGIDFGETTPDGNISLETTACMGMCDQAPAALVNDVVVTELSTDKVRRIIAELRRSLDPERLVTKLGDGNNEHDLVHAMVHNNIRSAGPVVLAGLGAGKALKKALAMTPQEVIRSLKASRLRGRGGAGFPTGMKWEFTRAALSLGSDKYVICNADEGEPGTFKDRVILTEYPDILIEGMTIAGYAIGAAHGVLYLRGEYAYLRAFLEQELAKRRELGLLGRDVAGKTGFDFDIRVQMGAGAYICGEETALISSCEGLRGDPKNRPPFPAQKGMLGRPTSVNNVETFCSVARILERGSGWFNQLGSKGSPGTKLLSISGDCNRPGVYEMEFGTPLREVLKLAGGLNAQAVQVGGPSGELVGPEQFDRAICYDDLATGGAIVVFGADRDLLEVVAEYLEFFVEESCGYCTPCRVGNLLLKQRIDHIRAGRGEKADVAYLQELGESIRFTSRCGLGQTSPNPVLSSLRNFPALYEEVLKEETRGFHRRFDLASAVSKAEEIVGRKSSHSEEAGAV